MSNAHQHSSHTSPHPITPQNVHPQTHSLAANASLTNIPSQSRHKRHKSKKKSKHSHTQPPYPAYNPLWEPVTIIANRYAMGPKIGCGSFGSVHAGVDTQDNHRYIAIKLEPINPNHHPQLEREYKIYTAIPPHIGIPKIFYFGRVEGFPFNALIMDMLGPSLERLFNICHRTFSLKTVLMIADQMLSRLEFIHDSGYLHRDLKPDNFLMGMYNSERVVYAVDLGLGKLYLNNGRHIPYTEGKTLTGTARYASVNTHLGVEQSRRDDLESLGYIFMYFLRGKLPWQGIKAKTRHEKYEKIARKKLSTLPEQLCKGYPEEFAHLIRYSWRLGYEERPNYEQLRRMFREVFFKLGFTADWEYDWDIKGMGATKLALENHPFIRGNVPNDKSHRKHHKRREVSIGDDCKETAKVDLVWGGDKHREHSKGRKHRKQSQKHSKQRTQKQKSERNKSVPSIPIPHKRTHAHRQHSRLHINHTHLRNNNTIISAHIRNESHNQQKYSTCLPGINAQNSPKPPHNRSNDEYKSYNTTQSPQTNSRTKNKFLNWDIGGCFGNKKVSNVNTEKRVLPIRRSSANTLKKHKHTQRQSVQTSPNMSNTKRLSLPNTHTFQRSPVKYTYYQQSPAYSPAHMRHTPQYSPQTYHNNNVYTPSYSHQSSSPSPIHHRRYSDNYANKPIITTTHHSYNPNTHTHSPQHSQPNNGYIMGTPNAPNAPQRLQRSQSHRLQGRRSVLLNDESPKKSSAECYAEWKQKYANPNCDEILYPIDHSPLQQRQYTYPYYSNNNTPSHSPIQQNRNANANANAFYNNAQNHYFGIPNPSDMPLNLPPFQDELSYSNTNNNNKSYNNLISTVNELSNLNFGDCNELPHFEPIPIENEKKNTSSVPLKIALKKFINKLNSPRSVKTPVSVGSKCKSKSPRSKGSNKSQKSQKSNKSHRSSRNHSHSKHSSQSMSNHSNQKRLSPKSNKSLKSKSKSNSPVLDTNTNLKSPNKNSKNSEKFVRSKSHNSQCKSYHSQSSSMLVNYESQKNTNEKVKSRMSVINDIEIEGDETDEFKSVLEKQWTGRSGRSITNNTLNTLTVTKDEKERKNSASTSKGLLSNDQRDFSSHTETINNARRQTTPRSYTVNAMQHPFVKNCSNSSTQQTVSSDVFLCNAKAKLSSNNNQNITIKEE